MGEQQQQQTSSSTTSLLIKLINLFTKSLGSSQQEGNRLTTTGDLREKNSTSSFRAQLAQLRALKSMPIRRRRDNTESSSTGNLGMRRNLLAAIARLASEVSDAIPMTVSEKNEISFPVHECRWRRWSRMVWKILQSIDRNANTMRRRELRIKHLTRTSFVFHNHMKRTKQGIYKRIPRQKVGLGD